MSAISNNEIKLIKSLSLKKNRDELGLFVVEGEKMVEEAISSSFDVKKVFRRADVGEETMSKISLLSSSSPVLALVKKPVSELPQIKTNGLFLALDSLRDPGNLGTIIRIADWFGIDSIYATEDTVDVYNPKVVQATMGAIFRVNFHYCDIVDLSKQVISKGGNVYGTFLNGEDIYSKQIATGNESPVVVVIGNESRGISPAMESVVSDRLFIPPYPKDCRSSESLNAAIATAITLAEFRRRG